MFSAFAKSHTQTSASNSTYRIRIRVVSPNNLKSSARSYSFSSSGICGQTDGSVVPGMVGLEAGQSAFGDVYAWLKNMLAYAGTVSIAELEKDAASVAPGSGGICAIDWFNGRRTPYANNNLHLGYIASSLSAS